MLTLITLGSLKKCCNRWNSLRYLASRSCDRARFEAICRLRRYDLSPDSTLLRNSSVREITFFLNLSFFVLVNLIVSANSQVLQFYWNSDPHGQRSAQSTICSQGLEIANQLILRNKCGARSRIYQKLENKWPSCDTMKYGGLGPRLQYTCRLPNYLERE